jgi:twinkle protein
MNAKELSDVMATNALRVAEYLLPGGKKCSGEWKCGDIGGGAGQSLGVRIAGTKAGVWSDFASGEGGDLLDLWMAVRSCDLRQAMSEAADFLGVKDLSSKVPLKASYKPSHRPEYSKPSGRVMQWLHDRGISNEAIKAYHVVASKDDKVTGMKDDQYVIFPFMRDGKLINFKARNIDNKKDQRISGGAEPLLFGWQAIPENARSVCICEGEPDALVLWQYGIPALSVQSGVSNLSWLDTDYANLERFSEIYLCMDGDEAGKEGAAKLVERLGRERCKVVHLPHKDANDCLKAGVSKADIHACFTEAKTQDPEVLRSASYYLDDVISEFYPSEDSQTGVFLPWAKTMQLVRLRYDEMSVWTGINGHGKSMVLSQVMASAMHQGERVCIASFEMRPKKTIWRMARQLSGSAAPSREVITQYVNWLDSRLWMFDFVGTSEVDFVLDVFKYARRRYGIRHFVIDSFLKLNVKEENDSQRVAISKIADFKNEYGCHVHLVCHSRKGRDESEAPGKLDVRGAGAITDMADNVFSVWRNKKKEEGECSPDDPDASIKCDKQRNGDWEGVVQLWYDQASMQYMETSSSLPRRTEIREDRKHEVVEMVDF